MMHNSGFSSFELLCLLSGLAGAIHVLSPDHWVPASILVWQRRWSRSRSLAFLISAFSAHALVGAGLYFATQSFILQLQAQQALELTLALIFVGTLIRAARAWRIRDVVLREPGSLWAMVAALSLLGPAESVFPILLKSQELRGGFLLPFAAFLFGTCLSGIALVELSGKAWNRPTWLPRMVEWTRQRTKSVPLAFGLILGLRLLFRLS